MFVTVAYNAGGIVQGGGVFMATDALLAENGGGTGADFQNASSSSLNTTVDNSLLGTNPLGGFGGQFNVVNVKPELSPLGDYGGPTETIALLPNTAGTGKGVAISGINADQRGFSLDAPTPDVGAFQTQPSNLLVVQSTGDGGTPAGEFDLRGAIDMAGFLGGVQAITFAPTVFATAQTINLTAGQLELSSGSATITAPEEGVTISGGGASSVFQIDSGATAVLSGGITLTCGSSSVPSNVFLNEGTLQIDDGVSFGTGTIINGGSLIFDESNTIAVSNANSGTGSISVEGGGSVTLTGSNTDTGSIAIVDSGTKLQSATTPAMAPDSVSGFGGNGTGWQSNKSGGFGATPITNNVVELTDGNESESSSDFDDTEVPTTGNFVASFTYTAASSGFPNNAADGVAFVLQHSDTFLYYALGGTGGGLGVSGIPGPGLVLSFNVYEPSGVGAGFFADATGSLSQNSGSYQSVSPVVLNNSDPKDVVISYDAAIDTLTEQLTDTDTHATKILTYSVNLGSIFGGEPAFVGFTGGSGGSTATQKIGNFSFNTGNPSTAVTQVNLSSSFNRIGIENDGTTFSATGGLDGSGNALSANLLGPQVFSNGQTFALGSAGFNDDIESIGQPVTLPQVNDSQLLILGTAVNGNQTNQTFLVNYTDGSTQAFTQSLSDSASSQNYTGESVAVTMSYRDTSSGGTGTGTYNLYGYSFNLDAGKTVKSITLPYNPDVEILAMDLMSTAPQVNVGTGALWSLGGSTTVTSIAGPGNIDLNGNTLSIGETPNQSSTFGGTIADGTAPDSAPGSVVTTGAGTLLLTGANTYSGGTTISGGTLQLGSSTALANGSVSINGGTLDLDGHGITTPLEVLGAGGALINSDMASAVGDSAGMSVTPGAFLTVGGAGNVMLSGQVASTGNFTVTKAGADILTLSGSGDNDALGLVVDAGTVILDKNSNDSPDVHAVGGGGLTVNSGGKVQLSGPGGYQIYEGADATVNAGGVLDLDGQNQSLTTGLLTLNGSGSNSEVLINSAGGPAATFAGNVSLESNSSIGGPGNLALAGNISGSGDLIVTGGGALLLSGANTYSGGTTISAGVLQVATGGSLGGGAVADNSSLVFNRSDSSTVANQISGSGTVYMEGGGTVTLSARTRTAAARRSVKARCKSAPTMRSALGQST